jgi:hypothetical protein
MNDTSSPRDTRNLAQRDSKAYAYLPAVARRQIYWIPNIEHGTWVENIDQFVKSLHEILKTPNTAIEDYKLENSPTLDDDEKGGFYPPSVLFDFRWQSFKVSISIERHHEFVAITTAVSLQSDTCENVLRKKVQTKLHELSVLTSCIHEATNKGHEKYGVEKSGDNVKSLQRYYRFFYAAIWRIFDAAVKQQSLSENEAFHQKNLKADIRGLICIRDSEKQKASDVMPDSEEKTALGDMTDPFFWLDRYQYDPARSIKPFDKDTESLRYAHTILPFMKAQKGANSDELLYTISRFYDGHCIYTTCMGAEQTPQHVRYFALTTPCNTFQASDLIEDINMLGTLRIAALHDQQKLNKTMEDLRKSEGALEELNKRTEIFFSPSPETDDEISKIAEALLGQSSKIRTIDKEAGGLSARIEHFRHYHKRFNALLATMKTQSIDGFTPYDQFVARRIGSTYEFFDMVGVKYERVQRTIKDLHRQLRRLEAIEAQKKSAEQTKKMTALQESGFPVSCIGKIECGESIA